MNSADNGRLQIGNIFTQLPDVLHTEAFEVLFENTAARIERIVSQGHVTPEEAWYDQDWDEWVLLLNGKAALLFEDGSERMELSAGDYVFIAAHRRHRVVWTDPQQPSIWLAIHLAPGKNADQG